MKSPKVSPKVVATIFMSQNRAVTAATLFAVLILFSVYFMNKELQTICIPVYFLYKNANRFRRNFELSGSGYFLTKI